MFQLHETTQLIPPYSTERVNIDNGMVPLIERLWAMGLKTMACCQDNGEAVEAERGQSRGSESTGQHGFIEYHRGWAWLKMPTQDTYSLLAALSEHETFGARIKVRWQRGSWRMHIPLIYEEMQFRAAPYAQIYFPKEQIAGLTAALSVLSELNRQ